MAGPIALETILRTLVIWLPGVFVVLDLLLVEEVALAFATALALLLFLRLELLPDAL